MLILEMSRANPLWGAPRIHGELLKLGFDVAQSTVAKYMVRRRGPPPQGWKTFLRNHAPNTAAMDLFVVPTVGFKLLYGIVIMRLGRRRLMWTNARTRPQNGSRSRSPRLFPGIRRPIISFGIAMVLTVPLSFAGCKPWEFVTIR
jgi:hypothetical protein